MNKRTNYRKVKQLVLTWSWFLSRAVYLVSHKV